MRLQSVLSVLLQSELEVPADSLTIIVPLDTRLEKEVFSISVYNGGELIFEGAADEALAIKSKSAALLRIKARSYAAGLLDSEAEPLRYADPSPALIAERHLLPFGITEYEADRRPMNGALRIDKGMSHWQVLEIFTRNNCGKMPRIVGRKAYLNGYSPEGEAVFGASGIPCLEIRERRSPGKLITSVRMMLDRSSGYSSALNNVNPECEGLLRLRYVNGLAENTNVDTARRILENSNRRSYSLRLLCGGCLSGLLGRKARLRDEDFGELGGLRVSGVRYSLSSRGEESYITLEKESF